jgi:hypothetical protein
MSEAGFKTGDIGSPPRSWQEVATPPTLGLHGLFFNSVGEHVNFPNYHFDINFEILTRNSRGVIDITQAARLRACLQSIANTAGNDFPQYEGIAEPAVRESQRKAARKFADGKINVHGEQMRRRDIIDSHSATHQLFEKLAQENHPVAQFIEQLRPALSEGLSRDTFEEIKEDLGVIATWPQLKAIYEQQIQSYRFITGLMRLASYIIRQ